MSKDAEQQICGIDKLKDLIMHNTRTIVNHSTYCQDFCKWIYCSRYYSRAGKASNYVG